ncbi:MAG: helix-turn-helix domain-containing protein [Lysobacterales bacterium]
MNLAIEFMEANLDGVLTIEDVANVACCSRYHFHRVFYASFAMTCAEYIRRRRLTLAAVELVNSKKNVVDVALKYGYESPNAFTRAFRNVHGINPSKARSASAILSSYHRVIFPAEAHGEQKMDYKIVEIPKFEIVGKSQKFEFESFAKNGPSFWKEYVGSEDYQKLMGLNDGMPGPVTAAPLLTGYFPKENGSRDEFIDILGLEITSEIQSDGFEVQAVPSATYAEFNCTYKSSLKTNRYIYGQWFGSTGYERDGNKPDIVAYFPIPFRPMNEMRVRWWIPVVGMK